MTVRRSESRAFTLIELITVMAISVILLTIIAIPMIQSFNLTRAAQGFADNQDKARSVISKIENEVSNAAGVRDNSGVAGSVAVTLPGLDGTPQRILLPNTKLDIFRPAEGNPLARVGNSFVNPDTGRVDPTLQAPKGEPNLPAAGGDVMVCYFVARRDPFNPYNNPFSQFKTSAAGTPLWLGAQRGQDNLYVLYRAEVPVWVYKTIGANNVRVVNSALFIDQSRIAGSNAVGPWFDDPDFMDPNHKGDAFPAYTTAYPGDPTSWAEMVHNWLNKAQIVTEFSRYDMVMPLFDKANEQVLFNGNVPQVVPLIRFQPTNVSSEPGKGQLAVRSGEETVNAPKVGPDVYTTQYGAWSNVSLTLWPSVYPGAFTFGNGSSGAVRGPWNGGGFIYTGQNALGQVELYEGTIPIFNISAYIDAKTQALNVPFSRAVEAGVTSPPVNTNFIPVVPDPQTGKVVASFDIREFGDPTAGAIRYDDEIPTDDPANPGILTGPAKPPSDPAYQAGPWQGFTTVNERFNRLWNVWDTLFPAGQSPSKEGPNGVKRSIDLRIKNQGLSTTPGPLSPANNVGRAYITPGSEVISGPDQTPGPNYGHTVRYTRVPNVDTISVGPNQYKINYVDKQEPDYTLFGLAGNYDPFHYDPADFVSAVIQPRYRAGYVELNSRYGEPIPNGYFDAANVFHPGNIYVTYRFQFTEPNDAIAVDYQSSQLMEVVLTIRNYPQTSIPNPQMTTVKGSAAVRNYIR